MASYLILLFLIQTVSSLKSPVIILDPKAGLRLYTNISTINPFHVTKTEEFTNLIHEVIHLSESILIFVEESFCVEDIASRDASGNPYKHIHRSFLEEKVKVIRSVLDPFKTLQRLLPPLESNVIYIGEVMKPLNKNFKYNYVYFTGAARSTETRVERLRRHDALIVQTVENLAKEHTGPVMAFYTGKSDLLQNARRALLQRPSLRENTVDNDTVMVITDKALIKLSGVVLQQGNNRTSLYKPKDLTTTETSEGNRIKASISYPADEIHLDFNFKYSDDNSTWTIESVVLLLGGESPEEVGREDMNVSAPNDWSYFCSEPLMIVNNNTKEYDTSYVIISKYQLEPLRNSTTVEGGSTKNTTKNNTMREGGSSGGKCNDTLQKCNFTNTKTCGMHFNIPILMGLIVAALVIAITLCGVTVLLDCGSNDRMDDPNQKPLVITAQM